MTDPEDVRRPGRPQAAAETPERTAHGSTAVGPHSTAPARPADPVDTADPVDRVDRVDTVESAGAPPPVTSGGSARDDRSAPDPHATTELPRTQWPDRPADASPTTSDWSSEPVRDYPAYRPQSYPTYPPAHVSTTELPAVGPGGPPPASGAGYPAPGAAPNWADPNRTVTAAANEGKPRRRDSAGFAGALGLVGLCAAAVGAFALPIQRFPQDQNAYFGNYRDLSTRRTTPGRANAHSISVVGGHIATDWWRFGVFTALGVLALLFLIKICVPALRRVAGVLLLLGGLAAAAGFLLGAHQTNDYRSATVLGHIRRMSWHHLAYGFWVAVGGCAVVALAGLIATLQSTRR